MITVNNQQLEHTPNMTVADVLKALNYDYPLITVVVNDQPIPREKFDSTTIPDNANIKAIHICHGG